MNWGRIKRGNRRRRVERGVMIETMVSCGMGIRHQRARRVRGEFSREGGRLSVSATASTGFPPALSNRRFDVNSRCR